MEIYEFSLTIRGAFESREDCDAAYATLVRASNDLDLVVEENFSRLSDIVMDGETRRKIADATQRAKDNLLKKAGEEEQAREQTKELRKEGPIGQEGA